MIPSIVVEKTEENQRQLLACSKYRAGLDAIKKALENMNKYKDSLVEENLNNLFSLHILEVMCRVNFLFWGNICRLSINLSTVLKFVS